MNNKLKLEFNLYLELAGPLDAYISTTYSLHQRANQLKVSKRKLKAPT